MSISRRETLVAGSAFIAAPALGQSRLRPTPDQTEGPFYPDRMPAETDPDLVRVAGQMRRAGGELLQLGGRILGVDGRPVIGATVEIWQVDVNGRYIHTADAQRGGRDLAFQGFGRTRVDAQGRYAFRTIRPVSYGSRTPHIHYKVYRPNGQVLTTQMVIAGEPQNQRDGVYRSVRPSDRDLTEARLERAADGWTTTWDVVLA